MSEVGNEGLLNAEIEADVRKPIALQIAFGNTVAMIDVDGKRFVKNRGHNAISFIEPLLAGPLFESGLVGSGDMLPVVYEDDQLRIPGGCGVILGPANVGKTPLLKWIVSMADGRLIRFGEPFPGYITEESEAAVALMDALLDPDVKLIAIDSIKDVLVDMHGGLMARGIPRGVFRMLSQWASVAASVGKAIVVPLNISTDDKAALDEVSAAILSNTTFSLIGGASAAKSSNPIFEFVGRTGEGKRRVSQRWSVQYVADGEIQVDVSGDALPSVKTTSSNGKVSDSNIVLPLEASRKALARVLTQAFATNDQEEI